MVMPREFVKLRGSQRRLEPWALPLGKIWICKSFPGRIQLYEHAQRDIIRVALRALLRPDLQMRVFRIGKLLFFIGLVLVV